MHVFLKGPIQIGKSTILLSVTEKLIKENKVIPGGFLTHSKFPEDINLYISPFGELPIYDEVHCIGRRGIGCAFGFYNIFDTMGVKILLEAQQKSGLLCMDELGFLENEALLFQRSVLSCLDGSIPVLGVIKGKRVPWHDAITSHPNVTVIDVTLENRSKLANEICNIILK